MNWPKTEPYPLWYFNRRGVGKDGKPLSDKGYVLKMMAIIPLEHKRKIADRYEIIYQKPTTTGNRKRANTFLNKIAKWFYTKLAKHEYRKVDNGVCCCGSSQCDADHSHSYVNAKQYAIDNMVNIKLGLVT